MSITVTRSGHMTTKWDALRKRLAPKVERGVKAAAEVLMAASQELVPVETMALKDSGKVRKKKGGLVSEFIVGYGNKLFTAEAYPDRARRPPREYAVYVHQMHIKFLEIPYESKRAEMRQALNQQMLQK